jgi:hypothetical protein
MRCWTVFLLLSLAGCSGTARERMAVITTDADEAQAEFLDCQEQVFAEPNYSEIVARLPVRFNGNNPEQLTDRALLRPDQRPAAEAFFDDTARCRLRFATGIARHMPEMWRAHDEAAAATHPVRTNLLAGTMTWGEANSRNAVITANYRARVTRTINREMDRLDAADAEEMQDWEDTVGTVLDIVGAVADTYAQQPVGIRARVGRRR